MEESGKNYALSRNMFADSHPYTIYTVPYTKIFTNGRAAAKKQDAAGNSGTKNAKHQKRTTLSFFKLMFCLKFGLC
jgi:uncharacterized membrane protein